MTGSLADGRLCSYKCFLEEDSQEKRGEGSRVGQGRQGKERSKNGSKLESGFSLGSGGALEDELSHGVGDTLRRGAFCSPCLPLVVGILGTDKCNLLGKVAPCSLPQGGNKCYKPTFTHPGDSGAELVNGVRWGTQCSLLRWNYKFCWTMLSFRIK